MYNIKQVKESFELTLDNILSKTTEYEIYKKYLGNFTIGKLYNCPYRTDKHPSFGVFIARNGTLLFKDLANDISGNVVKFVGLMTNLTKYNDILARIKSDLHITNNSKPVVHKTLIPHTTDIGIVRQDFTKEDIDYWSKYSISTKTLKCFNVYSIKYYLSNSIVRFIYKSDCPMFAYKVGNHFKIYRPYSTTKQNKWRNNLTEDDIQGYEQLPESGDILIITKSLKDVMVLYEMGICAIASSSESTFITKKALNALKKRFKRIIVLYDRDTTGIRESAAISLKTGLETILVDEQFNAKDISDAVDNFGKTKVKNWLYKLLNENKENENKTM